MIGRVTLTHRRPFVRPKTRGDRDVLKMLTAATIALLLVAATAYPQSAGRA
jgi:hypothetical protein